MSIHSPTSVRDATIDDASDVARIYNHYVGSTAVTFETDEVDAAQIAARISATQNLGYPWLVAIVGDVVAGYAYAGPFSGRCAYERTAEISVYLDADRQRQGIGSALYEHLFTRLRTGDTHSLIAVIALPNPPSVALHERFGMRQVAHLHEVGWKFGRFIDVGYWQTTLSGKQTPPTSA